MMRSMFSGVTGLKTHQTKMDVIGNNIANVNTTSFKSDSINFSELLYQSQGYASAANPTTGRAGINPKQIGLGVQTAAINKTITTGGAAMTTGIGTDVKINGDAFFIVSPDGATNYFTRDGSFYIDGAGNLATTQGGLNVMGWQVDETTGTISKDTVSALRVMSAANLQYPPEATTKGYLEGILDKNEPDADTSQGKMMNFAFYDDLGYSYTARFALKKTENIGEYTVELRDVLDSNGKSLKDVYGLNFLGDMVTFGGVGTVKESPTLYSPLSGVGVARGLNNIPATHTYTDNQGNDFFYTREVPPAGVLSDYTANRLPGLRYNVVDPANGNPYTTDQTFQPGATVAMKGVGTMSYDDLLAKGIVQDKDDPCVFYKDGQFAAPDNMHNPTGNPTTLYLPGNKAGVNGAEMTPSTIADWAQALDLPDATAGGATVGLQNINVNPDGTAEVTVLQNFTVGGAAGDPDVTFYANKNLFGTVITYYEALGLDPTEKNYDDHEFNPDGQAWIRATSDYDGNLLKFDEKTGLFQSVGGNLSGLTTIDFNTQALNREGDTIQFGAFHDITLDWSKVVWYNNGGASTITANAGEEKTGIGAGRRVGNMSGISISNDGTIYATYDNGMNRLVGQIAVARFANAAGLQKAGDNLYTVTANSGAFNGIGEDITQNGTDSLTTGVLEMSNVDLSNEFTHMITTQRGFQANSRIITVSDTLLEELINLKR